MAQRNRPGLPRQQHRHHPAPGRSDTAASDGRRVLRARRDTAHSGATQPTCESSSPRFTVVAKHHLSILRRRQDSPSIASAYFRTHPTCDPVGTAICDTSPAPPDPRCWVSIRVDVGKANCRREAEVRASGLAAPSGPARGPAGAAIAHARAKCRRAGSPRGRGRREAEASGLAAPSGPRDGCRGANGQTRREPFTRLLSLNPGCNDRGLRQPFA
jgi:hypothetical protein